MSKNRSILLIVEGERTEPKLVERVLEVYGIKDVEGVYPYGTNIYDLWHRMFEGMDDLDDLSLTLTLRERETDPEKRKLLDRDYSDIILVFDFDPQDHQYSPEKLKEMARYFNESTENGKLYLNYPMIESYKDMLILPYDEKYNNRNISMELLKTKRYKEVVGARSKIPSIEACSTPVFDQILLQNIEKASLLVGYPFMISDLERIYEALTQESILMVEAELVESKAMVSVLCTCLWFVIDYGPLKMMRHLRSFYL